MPAIIYLSPPGRGDDDERLVAKHRCGSGRSAASVGAGSTLFLFRNPKCAGAGRSDRGDRPRTRRGAPTAGRGRISNAIEERARRSMATRQGLGPREKQRSAGARGAPRMCALADLPCRSGSAYEERPASSASASHGATRASPRLNARYAAPEGCGRTSPELVRCRVWRSGCAGLWCRGSRDDDRRRQHLRVIGEIAAPRTGTSELARGHGGRRGAPSGVPVGTIQDG